MGTPKHLALLSFLFLLVGSAQAGFLTPGLERQLQTLQDDHSIKVLVVMNRQADIRFLDWQLHEQKATLGHRHKVVVDVLKDQAREGQAALLNDLEESKARGVVQGYTSHWLVNAVVVRATVAQVRELSSRPDVERIEADLVVELIAPVDAVSGRGARGIGITPGVVAVGARRVWDELGIDGSGVIVGNLDTGVDGLHVALASRWQGNISNPAHCWRDFSGLGLTTPHDLHPYGHGSHVMGTITGRAADDTVGVAPGATWIAANPIFLNSGPDHDNAVLASLEFMADPDGNPSTTADVPVVVQNSWGVNEGYAGYIDCDSRWWDAIDNCEAAGVCLVWSAGNDGPTRQTIRSPADRATSPTNCFSVGSTVTFPPYEISSFSSRGTSGCGGEWGVKPEIVAPGSEIYSVQAGGGYVSYSGTSMAGPHVAGVVALMRSANLNLDVITVKEILMATAIDKGVPGEDNDYGHGFVDAFAAVRAVLDGFGTLNGNVKSSSTGWPIEGVCLESKNGDFRTWTDARGYFRMGLPAGEAILTISGFGYDRQSLAVTIPADGVLYRRVDLNALPEVTVTGRVFGPRGNPVFGAVVTALSTPLEPVKTDSNGDYRLVLPGGPGQFYEVQASGAGLGSQVLPLELEGNAVLDFHLPIFYGEDFESADFLSYDWQMGGEANWVIESGEHFSGQYCARSGEVGFDQSSTLMLPLDVAEASPLAFHFKVSSVYQLDTFRFFLDDELMGQWSGDVDWQELRILVDPGSHVFSWTFHRRSSQSSGADACFIDLVELPQSLLPALALDIESVEATLAPGTTDDQSLTLINFGTGNLDYDLILYEVGDRAGGGPDGFGYHWTDSDEPGGPVYSWIDISDSGTVPGDADEGHYGPFPLGFDFPFYGQVFDSVNICSNGWLSFSSTESVYENVGIPDSSEPNNLVAPFWDDMNPYFGGTIYYQSFADRFIVQYEGVNHYPNGNPETFEVILNSDGSILFQYQRVRDGAGCSVGIENGAGDDGLQIVANAPYLRDELAIRITDEPGLSWVVSNIESGQIPGGAQQEINLHFDTAGLDQGLHEARLAIRSNNPSERLVELPISLLVTDLVVAPDAPPAILTLVGAVPNPFNPMTEIRFRLPREVRVSLRIYDLSGRLVRELVNETLAAGEHGVSWQGRDHADQSVASGTYFLRLEAGGKTRVGRVALVR